MKPVIFFFSIFFLALLIVNFGATYSYSLLEKDILETAVLNHLETTIHSRVNHLRDFINLQKSEVEIATTHQELSNEELKKIKDISNEFYELFVLDPNGIIIASSDESQIGKDKSNDDYFINVKKGGYIKDIYYSETTKYYSIAISMPQKENVLVANIKLDRLDKITGDRSGLGETGEVYLINKEGYMISSSRFKEDAILNQKVDTIGSRNCLSMLENPIMEGTEMEHEHIGHEGVEAYLDYRGEKVIGTHHPIYEMKWCVLAEIDDEEVYNKIKGKNFTELLITSLIVSLGVVFIGFLFWVFVLRKLKWRVKK